MGRLRQNNRGVTYIDFIFAVLVTALGTIATLRMLSAASHSATQNECRIIAAQIARTEIETIRSGKGYLLPNRTDSSLISTPYNLNKLPGGTATLSVANSTLVTNGKDITVKVGWKTDGGSTKQLVFQTTVSANGPGS